MQSTAPIVPAQPDYVPNAVNVRDNTIQGGDFAREIVEYRDQVTVDTVHVLGSHIPKSATNSGSATIIIENNRIEGGRFAHEITQYGGTTQAIEEVYDEAPHTAEPEGPWVIHSWRRADSTI